MPSGENIYQTLGLCNDKCQGKFAYAVLQYQECWCSNDKPSETVSVDECNQTCPGYPDQKCGNKGAGLYAYVPLDGAPISSSNGTSSVSTLYTSPAASSEKKSMDVCTHTNSTNRLLRPPDLSPLPPTPPCPAAPPSAPALTQPGQTPPLQQAERATATAATVLRQTVLMISTALPTALASLLWVLLSVSP